MFLIFIVVSGREHFSVTHFNSKVPTSTRYYTPYLPDPYNSLLYYF